MRYIHDHILQDLNRKMVFIGEVKLSDDKVSPHLAYYLEKLDPPRATQIVARLRHPFSRGRLQIVDPMTYFHRDTHGES